MNLKRLLIHNSCSLLIRFNLIIFFILTINNYSFAQKELGIGGGFNFNTLSIPHQNGNNVKTIPKLGYSLFFHSRFFLNKSFDLVFEPGVSEKNYQRRAIDNQYIEETIINKYLQLPINLDTKIFSSKKKTTYLTIGATIGYWIKSETRGYLPDIFSSFSSFNNTEHYNLIYFNKKNAFDKKKDRRYDIAINLGFRESFYIRNTVLSINAFITKSITSQQKTYMLNQEMRSNQSITLQIAYSKKLKHHEDE
ncbi:outer membrane beta-barrel protein [Pedobacter sp. MR2016-19]|uniref:outer membrane beta-barrel protein n=1 Tax=Pedobacter sp. MR2016-19 TaxID=2780089 RepID=UPI001875E0E4|nr:outer membrane beta-barrel protein [Pedobacter sp. MR2016-19]MBE5319030.1 outer membrane beta-barrel protein [Pedobacter sp. MR2016-19]